MKLHALIVDDEPPALSKLRRLLAAHAEIEVVGEAADGLEAIQQILNLRPDLLFLDIQMPQADGFDVLREVYPQHKPAVIFTTAYDQYAVRAFEVEAVDYLLKPFTAERLNTALERALRARETPSVEDQKLARLLERLQVNPTRTPRILVRDGGRLFFVRAADVEYIEAEEKYVLLHTRSQNHMIRQSMSELETRLAPASFIRIHRGFLLNLEALQEIVPWAHGDCVAVLRSGARLRIGRQYKERLLQAMGSGVNL